MKNRILACWVAAALLCVSCGTITTRSRGFHQRLPRDACMARVFSGTMWDLHVMDPSTAIGSPEDGEPVEGVDPGFAWIRLFDLPLSLIADTIMLPFSIFEQAYSGSYCEKQARR